MRLCTECHWDDWDRIVDIFPERCDKLPGYINILVDCSGEIVFRGNDCISGDSPLDAGVHPVRRVCA